MARTINADMLSIRALERSDEERGGNGVRFVRVHAGREGKAVSQPYAPGGTVYWTTNTYDGLGRTIRVDLPGGTGFSTYVYAGNTVKKTDPSGRWKKYTMDATGNPTKVTEGFSRPRPLPIHAAEAPEGGADPETTYAYNVLNKLTTVTMTRGAVTQTRTFVYNGDQGLQTVTNPETGTTTYAYNADGTVLRKTDAKGQKTEYTYDTNQRVTFVNRFAAGSTVPDPCQWVSYTYDTNTEDPNYGQNLQGKVSVVTYPACGSPYTYRQEMYSYTAAGQMAKKRWRWRWQGQNGAEYVDSEQLATYDNEGRLTWKSVVAYLYTVYANTNGHVYTYDTMGRAAGMAQRTLNGDGVWQTTDIVKDVMYGPAGEMTQMKVGLPGQYSAGPFYTETRTYNARVQLTRQTAVVPGGGMPALDLEYRYSGTANDGKLTQAKDWVTGEEVTYQYDALGRLIAAATTGPEWGLSFGYDGFGNRTTQTVTKGAAPTSYLNYDGNNRIVGSGFGYDANGNMTQMPGVTGTMTYDVANRLKTAAGETYSYGADNRRHWKTSGGTQTWTYWGIDGRMAGEFTWTNGVPTAGPVAELWFAGRLIRTRDGTTVFTDRVGSVRLRVTTAGGPSERHGYFPYGEEQTATLGNRPKYGTYTRDAATGLDYADQRYYGSGLGRFTTSDPYQASGGASQPGSWNRYAYVSGDPINRYDPRGLAEEEPGTPQVWCAALGTWTNEANCDLASNPGSGATQNMTYCSDGTAVYQGVCAGDVSASANKGPYNLTFQQVESLARKAADTISKKKKWSKDCEKLLAGIGTSGSAISSAAGGVKFYEGPGSTVLRASLYANSAAGASAIALFGDQTVGDYLADREADVGGNRVKAMADLKGDRVFLNTKWFGGGFYDDMATVMHELVHNVTGLADENIADRLPRGQDLSNALKTTCF